MLVIAMETGSDGRVRWAGRRHDDDRPDASSGVSPAELFDAVFHALHDGEQVALGLDCALTMPVAPAPAAPAPAGPGPDAGTDVGTDADADALVTLAEPAASRPGLAELGYLLGELGTWRPWTTVSTSLTRWKANTSILVWQAVPAPGEDAVTASAAADSFFRQLPAASAQRTKPAGEAGEADEADEADGTLVNLAAAAARRAGLFVDPAELARPTVSIAVTGGWRLRLPAGERDQPLQDGSRRSGRHLGGEAAAPLVLSDQLPGLVQHVAGDLQRDVDLAPGRPGDVPTVHEQLERDDLHGQAGRQRDRRAVEGGSGRRGRELTHGRAAACRPAAGELRRWPRTGWGAGE